MDVNGIRNKLENANVQQTLHRADIICINEAKTPCRFWLPGYATYQSGDDNRHRGGRAVMLKNNLNDSSYGSNIVMVTNTMT